PTDQLQRSSAAERHSTTHPVSLSALCALRGRKQRIAGAGAPQDAPAPPPPSYIPGATRRSPPPVIVNSARRLRARAVSLLAGASGRSSPMVSVVNRLALMPKPVR